MGKYHKNMADHLRFRAMAGKPSPLFDNRSCTLPELIRQYRKKHLKTIDPAGNSGCSQGFIGLAEDFSDYKIPPWLPDWYCAIAYLEQTDKTGINTICQQKRR
jgi:hypothetical protein